MPRGTATPQRELAPIKARCQQAQRRHARHYGRMNRETDRKDDHEEG